MSNVQQAEGEAAVPDRAPGGIFMALAAMPLVGAGLLLIFAWHTSRTFGAWPSYGNPDPKDANAALHIASGLTVLAAIPSVAALVVGLPLFRQLRLRRNDFLTIAVGIVGLVVLGAVFADLGEWYMD